MLNFVIKGAVMNNNLNKKESIEQIQDKKNNKKDLKYYLNNCKSNNIQRAINEFKYAGWIDDNYDFKDEMQEKICLNVLDILYLISKQNHSGFSFNYLYNLLKTILDDDTLTELTGKSGEWIKINNNETILFQNKRCSRIFREIHDDGTVEDYFIDGKIFIDPDGDSYTSKESVIPVKFPCYPPKKRYIKVDYNGNEIEEIKRE